MWTSFKKVWERIPKKIFYIIYVVLILTWVSRYLYDISINNATIDFWNLFWKLIFPLISISFSYFIVSYFIISLQLINENNSNQNQSYHVSRELPRLILETYTVNKFEITIYIKQKWKKKEKPSIDDFISNISFSSIRCACKYELTYESEAGVFGSMDYYFCSNPKCKIHKEKIHENRIAEFKRHIENNYKGKVRNEFDKYWELYKTKI